MGTAHFSEESQQDVITTIDRVRPEVVVLELCRARTAILSLDEETILQVMLQKKKNIFYAL